MKEQKPIGVFDSGLGGLTVLNELVKIMPNEDYIYVGDLENSPYGEKSPKEIKAIASDVIEYLISKDVKVIVVACNTASSIDVDEMREKYNVPIFTVVEAAIDAIEEKPEKTLLAATRATVNLGLYDKKLLLKYPGASLVKEACVDIVPAVESGSKDHEKNQAIVDLYINKHKDTGVDLLILGCTHYPLWKEYFENSIGEEVKILDPAKKLAEQTKDYLLENNLENMNGGYKEANVTKDMDLFKENISSILVGYNFDRIFSEKLQNN